MTVETHRLIARWPIEGQDVSIVDLRKEAMADLTNLATTRGWTYTAPPMWHIRHGIDPHLEATIPVHAPAQAQGEAA